MRMRKKAVALALSCAALVVGAQALASQDSLVSLSHLRDVFFPQAVQAGRETADNALQRSLDRAEEELEEARRQLQGGAATGGAFSADLRQREWDREQQLQLTTGAGVLLLQGSASVAHDGAVVDVTAGEEVPSGAVLSPGHRYLVGEETDATVSILSGWAAMGVQGSYRSSGGDPSLPFYDVSGADWFYAPVGYVYSNGLFSGLEEHRFGPGEPMTRAMLMTVLYKLAGAPAQELAEAQVQLSDVPDGAWFAPYVRWAVSQQLASGTGDGAFDPDGQVTREQLVAVLMRFAASYLDLHLEPGADLSGYSDVDQVSSWALEQMAWAVGEGIVSSTTQGGLTLSPRSSASRAQVAAMLRAFSENI